MKKTKLNPRHLYAIFAFMLSAVVVFCGVQIWQEYSSRQKDIDAFAELSELAEIKEPDEPKETAEPETDGDGDIGDEADPDMQEEQEAPAPTPRHDIPLLIGQNSDCIGWITIDNTAVDYPVMHTPDWPQKYLRLNFYQQYSDSGVPFLDYRCTLDSDNLIIFGHNMRMISQIKRILVYTFIYEGVANWQEANGVVTVRYPGSQDIIVRMDEYGTSQKMCAIALFENQNDQTFSVEKIVRFFDGHSHMDQAFNWGLRWVPGRK